MIPMNDMPMWRDIHFLYYGEYVEKLYIPVMYSLDSCDSDSRITILKIPIRLNIKSIDSTNSFGMI